MAALLYKPWSKRTSLYFSIQSQNIKTPDFFEFVRQLRKQTKRPIILVCDRYNVHRSAVRKLQEQGASWLQVEWLPPYAPNLNPINALWNRAKYADLSSCASGNSDELFDWVAESLNHQHFSPKLLNVFLRRAKLEERMDS